MLLAAPLFGGAEAVGFRLPGVGLPQQATDTAPYVATLVARAVRPAPQVGAP